MAQARPVALVTGATSGIGELAAAALAEAGFQVIGTGRDSSKTQARNGIAVIDLDVTSDQSVTDAVAQVISRFGRILPPRAPAERPRWWTCIATT